MTFEFLAGLVLIITSPFLIYLILTTAAAVLWPRKPTPETATHQRIAIVIPAHDEEKWIFDTVSHAFAQNYPSDAFTVWVIADNCTDNTANEARRAGANVLERQGNPGKGQALHQLFQQLLEADWNAFLVLDADSHLHNDTLAECNSLLNQGAQAVQIRYGVLNPEVSWRTRAMELSTASYNGLRPLGRSLLGLSSGIYGNGFCLSRGALEQVPYLAHSIVEDIEYHLLLLQAGIKVYFSDRVWVKARMPTTQAAARVQRVRWERGRWIMVKTHTMRLLKEFIQRKGRAFDGLLDVLMPPISLLALALLPALTLGNGWQRCIAATGIVVLAGHYLASAYLFGSVKHFFTLLAHLPWYILEKTWMLVHSFITQKHLPWIRTDRDS